MGKKDFKIDFSSKDFANELSDVARECIDEKGVEIECPMCHENVVIHTGITECPHCGVSLHFDFSV